MAEITAQLVKQLRDKTNAGMMDCQRALKETSGDLEAAAEWLRKKGISRADSKANRAAKEGIVTALLSEDGKTGVLLEINCETDFVAKNDNFRGFVDGIAKHALQSSAATLEQLLADSFNGATVEETIKAKIGEIGENIVLRRFQRFSAGDNAGVTSYIHMAGRVGVLLQTSAGKAETLASDAYKGLVKDLTLQIAASSPDYVVRDEVPAALRQKEEEINRERMQAELSKKPENIQAKIIEGVLNKFYAQVCLIEQGFIKEPEKSVGDLVQSVGKQLGDTIKIEKFARFALGEEAKA